MSRSEQKVVQYLDEAHAGEVALVRVLQSQIAMTPRGGYRSALETHLRETRDHAERAQTRLGELGQGGNPLQFLGGVAQKLAGQALALAKTPLDLVRGSGGEEKVLKNAKDACATEALEIATYTALERLARSVGDEQTAKLAASIRADEQKMLDRILRELPKLTAAVVGAEIEDDASYELSETGAAEATRAAGKTAAKSARKTGAKAKRSSRQARRVPGVAQAEGQAKGALASESDYERAHKARAGVLDATELNGNRPSPASVPARASDDHAVSDAQQEDLRAAAEAGDAAAAYALWEQLRDADFAAAEGWLRTAAELGDIRAAHRLGLLWRDRSDPQAAVRWLDRAAQADDPAAERDLGIVLREHGDIHGAHYWLSRAADRDGEARQALAELSGAH